MWCPAVLSREAVFGRVSSVCHQDGWIHFCRVLYTAIGIASRLWNWSWDFQGEKSIRRGKISVSSTRCSLGAEEMQIPLDFFTADCSSSTQSGAGCVSLSPLFLDGHCSKTSAYSQRCHSVCVSHLQEIWPSFSDFSCATEGFFIWVPWAEISQLLLKAFLLRPHRFLLGNWGYCSTLLERHTREQTSSDIPK